MAIKNKTLAGKKLIDFLEEKGFFGSQLDNTLKTINRIKELKKEKKAVILAHYYTRDGIKFGIADYIGDSLDLSRQAVKTEAEIILFCGVDFMAETAKILNPEKKVLLPSLEAGCSLAESITAQDVSRLRQKHPEVALVTYINTSAEIKAEVDVCVTSANAPRVISQLPLKEIIFLPDVYMGQNLAQEIKDKKFVLWKGTCLVHEQFTPGQIKAYRQDYPGLKVYYFSQLKLILNKLQCAEEIINCLS